MSYESDNPQFDHMMNNMDSDEVAVRWKRPTPLDEQLQAALAEAGFDETDVRNAVAAVMPVLRLRRSDV